MVIEVGFFLLILRLHYFSLRLQTMRHVRHVSYIRGRS